LAAVQISEKEFGIGKKWKQHRVNNDAITDSIEVFSF
jgi:hypothetical protein